MFNKQKDDGIDVIVLDIYDTILHGGGIYPTIKRDGLDDFLDRYQDKKIVLFTDSGGRSEFGTRIENKAREEIAQHLQNMNLEDKFDNIYTGKDMNKRLKNLQKVAEDYNTETSRIMMIGDGDTDEQSAQAYGTKFIKVPSMADEIYRGSKMICPENIEELYEKSSEYSFKNLKLKGMNLKLKLKNQLNKRRRE